MSTFIGAIQYFNRKESSMNKLFTVLISFAVLGSSVFAVEAFFPSEDEARERNFNQKLEEKIAAGEKKIYLRDLTDFEWDKVCHLVFAQDYNFSQRDISEIIDAEYDGYSPDQRCDTDKYNALVFVTSNSKNYLLNMDRCSPRLGQEKEYIRKNMCFYNTVYFRVYADERFPSSKFLTFLDK